MAVATPDRIGVGTGIDAGTGNVVELFGHAARARGRAPAIVGPRGETCWSFDGLADAAARLAGGLAALDIGPGTRVLVLEPDPRRRYAAVAAVLWAGATVTVPPASTSPWRAVATAATALPRAVLFGPRLWPIVAAHPALRGLPLRLVMGGPRLPGCVVLDGLRAAAIDPVPVADTAEALASFTSGSTGTPKLVVRTHGVLRGQHEALARLRRLTIEDRDLVGLPMLVLHNLGSGVTSIVPPADGSSSRYRAAVCDSLARSHPTTAVGFPHLFEAAASAGAAGLRDLRAIDLGGSRVSRDLVLMLRGLAPSARIQVVYGSTEIEPIAAIGAEEYATELGACESGSGICVGHPVAGLEVRLEPLSRAPAEVAGRPVGLVSVRGRHAAASHGAGGWVATGDAGWIDGPGRLWLLGRASNTVGRLFPFEVELEAERLTWVRRAALVRLRDGDAARSGLAVEPREDRPAARAERLRALALLVREHGWPIESIILRRRLPLLRGPSAKVDATRLRHNRGS